MATSRIFGAYPVVPVVKAEEIRPVFIRMSKNSKDDEMNMVGEPKTKRQHYVPQFFLRFFTDEGGAFAVLHNKRLSHDVSPKSICYKKNLYETHLSKGNEDVLFPNSLENTLGSTEEMFAKRLREQYELIMRSLYEKRLSIDQEGYMRALISSFIVSLVSRMPHEVVAAKDDVGKMIEVLKRNDARTIDEYVSNFHAAEREDFVDGSFDLEHVAESIAKVVRVFPLIAPESMETKGKRLLDSLLNSSMHILVTCQGHPFVGCSAPVIATDGNVLWMPMSSEICVCYTNDDRHKFDGCSLNHKELRAVNELILSVDNTEYFFCSRPDYLKKDGYCGKVDNRTPQSLLAPDLDDLLARCRPLSALPDVSSFVGGNRGV